MRVTRASPPSSELSQIPGSRFDTTPEPSPQDPRPEGSASAQPPHGDGSGENTNDLRQSSRDGGPPQQRTIAHTDQRESFDPVAPISRTGTRAEANASSAAGSRPQPDRSSLSIVEAINETLFAEMARDERVIVFGQDVALSGGVFRATDALQARFGPERVVDTPLSEAAIVGASVGLAAGGMVPVVEIQFLGFAHQAFHQIAGQVARLRYRSQGRFEAPITIRAPYGGGVRTPELHSDSIVGQLTNVPGLKIAVPSNPSDAKGLLAEAIRDPNPVLFLEPLRGYRGLKGPVPEGDYRVPFGQARWAAPGTDVTIIAWSFQVEVALRAARRLARQGVSAGVLDLRTLLPLDLESIVSAVQESGRVVIVEEAARTGGFGAEISSTVIEECFYSLEAAPVRVSGYDTPFPMGLLEDTYVPDTARIERAVRSLMDLHP